MDVRAAQAMTRRATGVGAVATLFALGASGCAAASRTPSASATSGAHPSVAVSTQPAPAGSTRRTTTLTRRATPPPGTGVVTKVLVFVEENHSLTEMTSQMPYTAGIARRFGYATHYTAIRHPSLPNYIAIAGGTTYGITNDDGPSAHPVPGASVFAQAIASGRTAAVYADGMPQNCASSDAPGSSYAVRHNPWTYFVKERATCQKYDVPVDQLGVAIAGGALPNVGMVVPNLCHDAHNCSLGTADTWFRSWLTRILKGPDWKSGHLAVVLTTDEDDRSAGNTVLTVLIHPSQKAHVVSTPLTHYSLTRLYEEVAGTPYLSAAASAASMSTAFGLPAG